ncbi:Uncharacterised protein [Mycobacteroides abscessus subsp. abscessus]|nr:Uncharacterised protein [Mycobacteroides abscessus subsp. abscessus]
MALSTNGHPCSSPKAIASAGAVTAVNAGTGRPSSASRVRMASLSWA